MYRAFGMAVIASLTVACSSAGNILGPDTAAISLTADNLTGRWAEAARIYRKVGAQTGVLADTVGVSSADQSIYQFNLDGTGIVRRVQPNPGQATYSIDSQSALHWNIDRFEGYGARLSETRLSLGDGLEVPYRFPGDNFPSPAQVTHVFARVEVP
jgi:hypothetical protein